MKLFHTIHKIITRYPVREIARTVMAEPALSWAYHRRKLTVPSLPSRMMIDPCNLCNLKCPVCPTGNRIKEITPTRMEYVLFEHIVHLNPNLKILDLYNLGEPFLNQDIFKMLALCNQKRIRTCIHTNISAYDHEMIDAIIAESPTRLHLSVDGVDQETYEQYRVEGDFDKVWRNMEYLSKKLKETGKGPSVEWAFLYHKGNVHKILEAEKKAQSLGFKFYARPLIVPQNQALKWHDQETLAREPVTFNADVTCPHLWLLMTIRPNGALAFCCFADLDKDDLSEPLSSISTPDQFLELWNSGIFRRARNCFNPRSSIRDIKNPILCEKCNLYPRFGGVDPEKYPFETPFHWMK